VSFNTFNLHPSIMAGVQANGFTEPTPIQEKSIPVILEGRDVLGLAQTGTGKTAAFVLPLMDRILHSPRGKVSAVIVSPTRELAEQICDAVNDLGQSTNIRCMAIYGGVNMDQQVRKIRRGVDIVVACPGRLLDHLWKGSLRLDKLQVLVIDEADRMFDMGFLPDIKNIMQCLPEQRQTLLFSATMPKNIRSLAEEILTDPVTVQIGITAPAKTVSHALLPVKQHLKSALLLEFLYQTDTDSVLIFTRTKHRAERVSEHLHKAGFSVTSLQGNMTQMRRKASLDGFRNGRYKILVATDIAARGIDVLQISHVINYDMPENVDAYTHRIGRTGRVNKNGDAITFITGSDKAMVRDIERVLKTTIERRTLEGFDYTVPMPKNSYGSAAPVSLAAGPAPRNNFRRNAPRSGQSYSSQEGAPRRNAPRAGQGNDLKEGAQKPFQRNKFNRNAEGNTTGNTPPRRRPPQTGSGNPRARNGNRRQAVGSGSFQSDKS